jgi:UDPglucose 6-dehydrogenase|tara:strand:- start:2407 stop:3654 length:1248 start_codon:yes stop_codon:yes gene_type:complete
MNIGFIGLGKLGLPCALAIESRGHNVVGYDPSEQVKDIVDTKKLQYQEIWAQDYLDKTNIKIKSVEQVVEHSEIIFVPIQTPHGDKFEGITRIPDEREDFDYTYLKQGIKSLSNEIERQGNDKIVVIISTVLPGTIRKEIIPLLGKHTKICYNPFFIAMGTTMRDFLKPEIVLFGVDDKNAAEKAKKFYRTLHHQPFYETTIENAELIKVVYNTFISSKIAIVNTIMELSHHLPNTNVDDVTNALKMCDDRIISDKYLSGGMGDGGGCHPRDNIALSWLSNKLNLSYDWFDNIMKQRELQTDWFADLIEDNLLEGGIVILGKSFKPETNIETGSPAHLLANILKERGHTFVHYDPLVDTYKISVDTPRTFFIGTKHDDFVNFNFPKGSIIIDPWRYIPDKKDCKVIQIGNRTNEL